MKCENKIKIINNKIFRKTYISKNQKNLAKKEFEKAKIIYELSKNNNFKFPKPIKQLNNSIEYEYIPKTTTLTKYIIKNNNIFKKENTQTKQIFKELGKTLKKIHTNLKLNKKEKIYLNKNKKNNRYLYGDFGLTNILITGSPSFEIFSSL